MTIEELALKLEKAWGKDTSALPEHWIPENPAIGQCAVTALIVQDHFGGKLVRAVVNGVSHYYNELPSETIVDLTFKQFEQTTASVLNICYRERDYVLHYPATCKRYYLLKSRL